MSSRVPRATNNQARTAKRSFDIVTFCQFFNSSKTVSRAVLWKIVEYRLGFYNLQSVTIMIFLHLSTWCHCSASKLTDRRPSTMFDGEQTLWDKAEPQSRSSHDPYKSRASDPYQIARDQIWNQKDFFLKLIVSRQARIESCGIFLLNVERTYRRWRWRKEWLKRKIYSCTLRKKSSNSTWIPGKCQRKRKSAETNRRYITYRIVICIG